MVSENFPQQGDEEKNMKIIQPGLTPNGQITIPRSIMKLLGIRGGGDVLIEVVNGMVVLKKIEERVEKEENSLIFKAV